MDLMYDDLNNTPAGDIRIWWGGAGNPTSRQLFMQGAGSEWELVRLKEGTSADEIREWRFKPDNELQLLGRTIQRHQYWWKLPLGKMTSSLDTLCRRGAMG